MSLSVTIQGTANDLPPILLVHGLFGQARNLGVLIRKCLETRQVIAVDMRNHGESFHDPDHSYDALAGDLADVIEAHGGVADVVGHSMGGKSAMWLALTRGELIRRLVVLDIAPVAYSHSQAGYIDAMEGLDLTGLRSRSEADRRLAQAVDEPGVRAFLLQSLDLKANPPEWKLNLPVLRASMENLTGWPGTGGRTWDGPALFLAGGDSDYVTEAGETAIREGFPNAVIERVPGTGHWLHAEKPAEVADRVATFVNGS